jgi:hypothetical protein
MPKDVKRPRIGAQRRRADGGGRCTEFKTESRVHVAESDTGGAFEFRGSLTAAGRSTMDWAAIGPQQTAAPKNARCRHAGPVSAEIA